MHRPRTGTILSLVSVIIVLPFLWLPLHLYKCLVLLVVWLFFPAYGKVFQYSDYLTEEILKEGFPPKSSVVCSMELEGHLTLEELRLLFKRNVLDASLKANRVTRYPELKQCPASFMGYTFWKVVEAFNLHDHIWDWDVEPTDQLDLSHLHNYMMNLPYSPERSPWSIALISQYSVDDKPRSLIIACFHHSMADAKSILKLFVSCLGQQPLSTAQPQLNMKHSFLLYPFRFMRSILRFSWLANKHWNHPWKNRLKWTGQGHPTQIVRLSPKLLLTDLKEVGRRSGGTTSSVILTLISGAVREVDPEVGKLLAAYILPKPDHPPTFTNHYTTGFLELPADCESAQDRLHTCNKTFRELKDSEIATHLHRPLGMIEAELNPVRKKHIKSIRSLPPVLITNIAGEGKGFSVGGCACSEFVFSVGTLESEVGLLFAISSYKEYCRIAVIVAEGVLSPAQTERIADRVGNELEILRQHGKNYESVIAMP